MIMIIPLLLLCGYIHNVTITAEMMNSPPVIDISSLFHSKSTIEYQNTIKQIDNASKLWGFFYIINHSIPIDTVTSLKEVMIEFFNSSEKYSIRRSLNNSRGFADDELTKQLPDKKEIFDMGHVPRPDLPYDDPKNRVLDGYNQYPSINKFQRFKQVVESYYNASTNLSKLLIRIIAEDLLNDTNHVIDDAFVNHTSLFRLNYYPIRYKTNHTDVSVTGEASLTDTNEVGLGISRHTDAGVLTLLYQDSPGLEVYTGSKQDHHDGIWVPVDPVDNAITVNLGDMLQVWSNGLYKAAEHRVRGSVDTVRYSAAYFFNPSYETIIEPLVQDPVIKYRPISWGYFRHQRFLGDYADYGKEIQIEDYAMIPSS